MITVAYKDAVNLAVKAESSILLELRDHFSFDVPGAKFTPHYKSRKWDGKIYLFSPMTKNLPVGLFDYLKKFAEDNEYSIDSTRYVPIKETVSVEDVAAFCKALNPHNGSGEPIALHDYQIEAIYIALNSGRRVLLSPTASGKSLIIYCLLRWHLLKKNKQLIVVPTTSLVEQMFTDFCDYSKANEWDVAANCSKIYTGKEKSNDSNVVITTWQSARLLPDKFFEPFSVVFGDEAHLFKAKELTGVMNKLKNAPYRYGTTGTLDGTQTNKLVLEGLFGPVYKVISTRDLIDQGKISDLKIYCIQLGYTEEERNACKKATYQQEIEFLISNEKRNKFIRNLTLSMKGNTLLLYQLVEKHGQILYDMICEKIAEGRKVFFIHGKVEAAAREEVRRITEQETNAIIVASFGTFSTGTNIRNLHNVIFASPSKSRIRNLQSIGRGLRKSDTKDSCNLYDISDDLTWKARKNFTLLHMIERIKIYAEEKFIYKFVKVDLIK